MYTSAALLSSLLVGVRAILVQCINFVCHVCKWVFYILVYGVGGACVRARPRSVPRQAYVCSMSGRKKRFQPSLGQLGGDRGPNPCKVFVGNIGYKVSQTIVLKSYVLVRTCARVRTSVSA